MFCSRSNTATKLRQQQSTAKIYTMEKSVYVQEPGGWTPVNPKDPHIIAIAEFAVKEYNKTAPIKLVFVAVVKGWKRIVEGTIYKLIIEARPEFIFPPFPYPHYYEAVVYEDLSGNLHLKSFVPLLSAEGPPSEEVDALMKLFKEMEDLKPTGVNAAGEKTVAIAGFDWDIVDPDDQTIKEIGEFAVAEHNKKTGAKLVFVEVISGLKLRVVAVNLYALLIRSKAGIHGALLFKAPFGYKKLLFWMN